MAVRSVPRTRSAPAANPWRTLAGLVRQARRSRLRDPDAMALATTGASGRPAVRMVLLRGIDARGLTFFTNYGSRKGRELAHRPFASVAFYWPSLQRQVRVEGRVRRLSAGESDAYFATRPREARLAAWASDQSKPVASRAALQARYRSMETHFRDRDVPRPPYWGGFVLIPDAFEYWRARSHRLHERVRFTRRGGLWRREVLAP